MLPPHLHLERKTRALDVPLLTLSFDLALKCFDLLLAFEPHCLYQTILEIGYVTAEMFLHGCSPRITLVSVSLLPSEVLLLSSLLIFLFLVVLGPILQPPHKLVNPPTKPHSCSQLSVRLTIPLLSLP